MHGRILPHHPSRVTKLGGVIHPRSAPQRAKTLWVAAASAIAAAHTASAVWLWSTAPAGVLFRSTAIVVLLGLSAGFGLAAYRRVHEAPRDVSAVPLAQRAYWYWCGLGLVASYGLALVLGPHPSAVYVFLISSASFHALIWHLLAGSPRRTSSLAAAFRNRLVRVASATLGSLLIVALAGEVTLRLYATAVDDLMMTRYVADRLKLPPGGEFQGQTVNSQGYWDDEFPMDVRRGGLRIAAVGDEAVLCGRAGTNFLAQIEQRVPGVEVLNFGVPHASPREYAAQLNDAVLPCHPDVLLICIAVANDITEAPQLPGPFDWRGLHLVRRTMEISLPVEACRERTRTIAGSVAQREQDNLEEVARQLQICRVPEQDRLRERWRAVFAELDRILQQARDAGIEPVLTVLPSDFQVDERLLQTLCRRAGYDPHQIDTDLPQRRLAGYAKDRRVPLLDLMPHLRASRKPAYRCEAAHLNEHGNALAAAILGEWLETEYGSILLARGK